MNVKAHNVITSI